MPDSEIGSGACWRWADPVIQGLTTSTEHGAWTATS